MKYILFFNKFKCENDGFFLVNEEFSMNIYKCKILSSFDSEEKGELKSINSNTFLIYESKSKQNYIELIE